MKMKRLIVLIALLMPMLASWAQDESSTPIKTITEVKQSEDRYLYADQTYTTVDQALTQANDQLMQEIKEYFQMMGKDFEAVKDEVASNMVTITMQRGDQFRAFVYIDKSIFDEKAEPQAGKGAELQPSDKPEPQVVQVEGTPVGSTTSSTTAATTVTVPPTTEVDDATAELLNAIVFAQLAKYSVFYEVFTEIVKMDSRLQVYDYVKDLQADGLPISFINQPKKDEMDDLFLLVYRRGGDIESLLTPVNEAGERYNLRTGELDSLKNHPKTSINGIRID